MVLFDIDKPTFAGNIVFDGRVSFFVNGNFDAPDHGVNNVPTFVRISETDNIANPVFRRNGHFLLNCGPGCPGPGSLIKDGTTGVHFLDLSVAVRHFERNVIVINGVQLGNVNKPDFSRHSSISFFAASRVAHALMNPPFPLVKTQM